VKLADILAPLFESAPLSLTRIDLDDTDGLQAFADFYNESGQLSWELNPTRLRSKLGATGVAYVLRDGDRVVGTIALKGAAVGPMQGAEVGYFMVDPAYRSFANAKRLYAAVMNHAEDYDFVFATTNTGNGTINKLSHYSKDFDLIFAAQSKFSSNMLHYWLARKSNDTYSFEEQTQHFEEEYN
jgi:GNAT superfamily N-acetyltransferase